MKNVLSSIGSILFYVMTCGLFVYAASRSLDFIQSTLPPDQKLIGYLGLLATEGGAVIWLIVFLRQASGVAQKAIAAVSAVIDMLGGIGMFTIDTLLRSGQAGTIVALTKDDIHNAILVLSGLIGFNLICAFAFHIVDPFNIARMQEESAHDTLQS